MAKVTIAERVIKATRCDWLLATTNVDFTRTLHNFRLTDSKIESVRRKSCSVRAKSTFVVASSQSQRVAFMTREARGGADQYVAGSTRIIRGD